jgi:hypothetical protein
MPFPPTPSITPSNTPTSSVTPSNTPTNTPSGTQCPDLTPTPTATITPSTTMIPNIYMNACLPSVVPEDGIVNFCLYSQVNADCGGERTPVLENISVFYQLYLCVPPEEGGCIAIVAPNITLTAGTSCNCDNFYELGASSSGITLSAITYGIFPAPSGTNANYIVGNICYDDCALCETPTPTPTITSTPTLTPTLSITPTLTPTTTPSPTPICCYQYEITNYYTSSQTVFFTNCDGTPGSVSAAGNGLQTIVNCAVQDSLSTSANICDGGTTDCVTWVQADTPCGGCV